MVLENKLDGESPQNNYGEVWIQDGRVFVKDPAGAGKFPAIIPCQGIDLFVNGIKVGEKTDVSEKDEIVVSPHSTEEPGTFEIRVAQDGLSAVLDLKMGTVSRYVIQDQKPAINLVLKAVRLVEKSCPCGLDEIMQEMAKKNISNGIRHGKIQDILLKPKDGHYLIAEGVAPGGTVDERVELKFAVGPEGQKVSDEVEKINFRDMVEIPSVESGALLAVKHPAVQGKPGRKVTGDIIPPAKPQVFDLKGGKGVDISPDGSRAYAKINGRPVAKKLGNCYTIDVDPVLQKRGDVDISSGNIRFKGDVVIYGDVCEGMMVQASGKINIAGMVFDARIAAQKDIIVGQNVTGSSLVAGSDNVFFKNFHKILEALHANLSEIAKLVPGLAQHPKLKEVKTGQLIQFLIDKKYPKVPGLIAEMIKLAGQNSFILSREMTQFLEKAEKSLSGLNLLKIDQIEQFQSLLSEMKDVQEAMDNMNHDKANITFGYCVNSKIEASGDVMVVGRGCINSAIHAGGNVNIKGVFRGGEILAGENVILKEAGSELEAKTLVKAGDGKKIFIGKAYGSVRVQIGKRWSNINSVQNNLKVELDEEGDLRFC